MPLRRFAINFDKKNANTISITSLNIKGSDTETKEVRKPLLVTRLNCNTPAKWQSKSPKPHKRIFKKGPAIFLEIPQKSVRIIKPIKNPPVGPKIT